MPARRTSRRRTVYARPRARARTRTRYAATRRRTMTRRRRSSGTGRQKTIRIVVQTVAASPLTVSGAMVKGRQITRAMF